MQAPIVLPICTIQPDFFSVIGEVREGVVPEESFWVSCYKSGEPSVHGKVSVTLDEHDRSLVRFAAKDGVEFESKGQAKYFTACPSLNIPSTWVVTPTRSYANFLPRQPSQARLRKIAAFDVSPDGSQFATGYDDGSVYLCRTSAPTTAVTSGKPHVSTITSLRFFPSSRVLLTASVDFSISILPADLPSPSAPSSPGTRITPARILRGHTRAVTSIAIISRGRNVLSGAKDGTLRLWDVSSGSQISALGASNYSPILAMTMDVRGEGAFTEPPDGEDGSAPPFADPREVETSDKVVFCALQDGTFEAFDLSSKLPVFHSSPARRLPALSSIAYAPAHSLLATGSSAGVVTVYDTRALNSPLVSFTRNGASVEELSFLSLPPAASGPAGVGLAVATEDGLPYIASVRPEGPSVYAELVGPDCDAVRSVRVGPGQGEVWTAGDDGVVRQYRDLCS